MKTYTIKCKECNQEFKTTCKEKRFCESCTDARAEAMLRRYEFECSRFNYQRELYKKPVEEIAGRLGVTPSQVRKLFDRMQLTVPDKDFYEGLNDQSCLIKLEEFRRDTGT